MMKKIVLIVFICATALFGYAETNAKEDLYSLQYDSIDLRFGVMMHFNMGTFTNEEWAEPNHDPATFNPVKLDCN